MVYMLRGGRHGAVALAFALIFSLSACPQSPCFEVTGPEIPGRVEAPYLKEISGVVASRANEGILWVHNDSGDQPRVYALHEDGAVWAILDVAGADARDWEDIAIGPGPEAGASYLYLADIGDNSRNRPFVTVYRLREPDLSNLTEPEVVLSGDVERFDLAYPEGEHVFDAEALFVDSRDGALYIVTKDLKNIDKGRAFVFRAATLEASDSPARLESVAVLSFLPGLPNQVTGADMAPDAHGILVRSYGALRYWGVGQGVSVAEAFGAPWCDMPFAIEPQGEAVAWTADNGGYITVSEAPGGAPQPLHVFRIGEPIVVN